MIKSHLMIPTCQILLSTPGPVAIDGFIDTYLVLRFWQKEMNKVCLQNEAKFIWHSPARVQLVGV